MFTETPAGAEEFRMRQLGAQFAGREVLLGDIAAGGAGVCRHRALMLKVLGDEAGLEVTLVRGRLSLHGSSGGHAWNEIVIDGRRLLVDPYRPPTYEFRTLTEVGDAYRGVDGGSIYGGGGG
jgi:hypothetical protein